jgi:hypothetical protein
VTCDWAIPEEAGTVQIRAMVDRGLEIDEGNEANNEAVLAVEISARQLADDASASGIEIGDGAFYGLTLLGLVAIVGAFIMFAPAKIKKLE